MGWKKYGPVSLLLVTALAGGYALAYFSSAGPSGSYARGKQIRQQAVKVQGKVSLVRFQTRYALCGHTEPAERPPVILNGESLTEVMAGFPPEEGWQAGLSAQGVLTLSRDEPGFCPEDGSKRHLGAKEGLVAVFLGPAGYDTEVVKVTPIRLTDLPGDWQDLISGGMLEFANESEVLQALDSLDEYRGR